MTDSACHEAEFLRADRCEATAAHSLGRQSGVQEHKITRKPRQQFRAYNLMSSLCDSPAVGNHYSGLTPLSLPTSLIVNGLYESGSARVFRAGGSTLSLPVPPGTGQRSWKKVRPEGPTRNVRSLVCRPFGALTNCLLRFRGFTAPAGIVSGLRPSITELWVTTRLTPGATACRHFVAVYSTALMVMFLLFISGCGKNKTSEPPATPGPTAQNEQANIQSQQMSADDSTDATPQTTTPNDTGENLAGQFPPLASLPDVPVPADNPISEAKAKLGKLLFFDNRLSGDLGTSCASCHDPRLGWGDGQAVSRGYAGTQHWRNSQTTINSAFYTKLFWAGEVPSLEAQAKSAATGNLAGNGDPVMIEERIAQMPEYLAMFQEAFGVDRPSFSHVLKAIATFERVEMISADSPFDEYLAGDEDALSDDAKLGLALFEGKAGCIQCHNGALMSDEDYHYLDLPQHSVFETDPLRQVALRYQHYIRGVPEDVYRSANDDLGLYYTTKNDSDKRRFRTPGLRYLEYTAPYMHNGVFSEIEEVIEYYNDGGGDDPNQSPLIKPLGLTEDEKFALAEFLYSLSGDEIRMNVPKLPEYKVMEDFASAAR